MGRTRSSCGPAALRVAGIVVAVSALGRLAASAETAATSLVCHVSSGRGGTTETTLALSEAAARRHAEHRSDHPGPCRDRSGAGDRDGDGVIDALDNCLDVRNPDQRDTDRDGFGNACDADFDNDGRVDRADLGILLAAIGRTPGVPTCGATLDPTSVEARQVRNLDLDGDGCLDEKDVRAFARLRGKGPGPVLDSDGDGTPDRRDVCTATLPGGRALVPGCTALDVLENAERVAAPTLLALDQVLEVEGPARERSDTPRAVGEVARAIRDALDTARAGEPCEAADVIGGSADRLGAVATEIGVRAEEAEQVAAESRDTDDAGDDDSSASALRLQQSLALDAQAAGHALQGTFARVCRAGRPVEIRARVRRTLDGQRRLVLADGRVLGLAEGLRLEGGTVRTGRRVQVRALEFVADGTGFATQLETRGSALPGPVAALPCVSLRFAPVQPQPPFAAGPPLLLDPRAYEHDAGFHLLESGMRIGAVAVPCNAAGGNDSLEADVEYTDRKTGLPVGPVSVAMDLMPGDQPAALPGAIDPDTQALLHVRTRRCDPNAGPDAAGCVVIRQKDYVLRVVDQGTLGTAAYESQLFAVNDQDPDAFQWARVTAVVPNVSKLWQVDPNTSPTFAAEAYVAYVNGLILFNVAGDAPFAIRNTDFYPVHPANAYASVVASLASGVDHAAGVRWPQAVGTNHGREFRYSLRLPKVVRDVVNFCPDRGVNAYYRLPFPANTTRTEGQANLPGPCCTHGNGFAYDMLGSCAAVLLAARGGVVFGVTESNSIQFDPAFGPGCTASCPNHGCSSSYQSFNVLWIKHQDGSFGQYVHFPQNGIVPAKGDVVPRGAVVGKIGVTGRTTGPHLHFAEKVDPGGQNCVFSPVVGGGCTRLALFETDAGGGWVGECYEPKKGDSMTSNNIQQP
jgi:hypothetical protein